MCIEHSYTRAESQHQHHHYHLLAQVTDRETACLESGRFIDSRNF